MTDTLYKAYDLPHRSPVAIELTHVEAARFDDEGFFVIPQDARLKDYPDEMRRIRESDEKEALRGIQSMRIMRPSRRQDYNEDDGDRPDYKAITRAVFQVK